MARPRKPAPPTLFPEWTFALLADPKITVVTTGQTWFVACQAAAVELKVEPSELACTKRPR